MLAGLIFGTPLTLYGAMFWEHALAVALTCGAVRHLLIAPGTNGSVRTSFVWGAVLGFTSWIRPECFALVGAVTAASFFCLRRQLGVRRWAAFSGGAALVVALFLLGNLWMYGVLLGTHGMQVTRAIAFFERLIRFARNLGALGYEFIVYVPVVVFAAAALLLRGRAPQRGGAILFLVLAGGLYLIGASAIVPHRGGLQFGPRYLFPAISIVFFLCALLLRDLGSASARPRGGLLVAAVAAVLVGSWANACAGSVRLA